MPKVRQACAWMTARSSFRGRRIALRNAADKDRQGTPGRLSKRGPTGRREKSYKNDGRWQNWARSVASGQTKDDDG